MRLHPSLLIAGLLVWRAVAVPAAHTGPPGHEHPAVDPAVRLWVMNAYPGVTDNEQIRKIALVLMEVRSGTSPEWYAKFLAVLPRAVPDGAALVGYYDAERADAVAAGKKLAADALRFDTTLEWPPANGFIDRSRLPARTQPLATGPTTSVPEVPAVPAETEVPRRETATPGGPTPREEDPVNALAAAIGQDEELRTKVRDRLVEFIWDPHREIDFIDPAIRTGDLKQFQQALREGTTAAVGVFVTSKPGAAAKIIAYIGLPADKRPARHSGLRVLDGVAASARGTTGEQALADALARWTRRARETVRLGNGDFAIAPLGKDNAVDWADAFLADAGVRVDELRGMDPLKAVDLINRHAGEEPVPGRDVPERDRRSPVRSGAGFGRAELFGQQGDEDVFAIGNADELAAGSNRVVSVRIVTEKGSDGRLVDRIAVYDITGDRAYGKTFPLDYSGKVQLKDGGREYSMEVSGGVVTLKGPDGTPAQPTKQGAPELKVGWMFEERVRRAQAGGRVIDIGGEEFLVWGQATRDGGANVFIPRSAVSALSAGGADPGALRPAAIAMLNERVGGQDRRLSGARPLYADGEQLTIGGKVWHLEWSASDGMFVPVEGRVAETPPATTGTTTTADPNNPQGPGTTTGETTTEDRRGSTRADSGRCDPTKVTRDADGWPLPCGDNGLLIPYVRAPASNENPNVDVIALNRQLEADGAVARIYQIDRARTNAAQLKLENLWLVVYKTGEYGGMPLYTRAIPNSEPPANVPVRQIVGARVSGGALRTEDDLGVQYTDLKAPYTGPRLATVGVYDKKFENGKDNIVDVARVDILNEFLGFARFAEPKRTEIVTKVREVHERGLARGDRFGAYEVTAAIPARAPFRISGAANPAGRDEDKLLVMNITGLASLNLSPTLGGNTPPRGNPTDSTLQPVNGWTTFAMDRAGTSPVAWENFPSPRTITGSVQGTVVLADPESYKADRTVDPAHKGARLYRTTDEKNNGAAVERWYLVYSIDPHSSQAAVGTQQSLPKMVFEKPSRDKFPPENIAAISLRGLNYAAPPATTMLYGELIEPYNRDATKGVYAVFDAPSSAQTRDRHCVGVVMWWGVNETELSGAKSTAGCP